MEKTYPGRKQAQGSSPPPLQPSRTPSTGLHVIKESQLLSLQRTRDGVAQELRTPFHGGRFEIVTAGPNPEYVFIGSDPYETNVGTGLVVPTTPSASIGGARYLMMLARASFNASEAGVRLVGMRMYAEIVARVPIGSTGQVTT